MVINTKDYRIGYIRIGYGEKHLIIETDIPFLAGKVDDSYTELGFFLSLLFVLRKNGYDITSYMNELGYPGLNEELVDLGFNSLETNPASLADTIVASNLSNNFSWIGSKDVILYYFAIQSAATDPVHSVDSYIQYYESKIEWQDDITEYCYVVSHQLNKESVFKLFTDWGDVLRSSL